MKKVGKGIIFLTGACLTIACISKLNKLYGRA